MKKKIEVVLQYGLSNYLIHNINENKTVFFAFLFFVFIQSFLHTYISLLLHSSVLCTVVYNFTFLFLFSLSLFLNYFIDYFSFLYTYFFSFFLSSVPQSPAIFHYFLFSARHLSLKKRNTSINSLSISIFLLSSLSLFGDLS